jgi:cobalt-zinc-cadmium efflux system protein
MRMKTIKHMFILGMCNHSHHDHMNEHPHDVSGNKKGLWVGLAIVVGIVGLELWGSLISNPLSLLSDAGHMIGDAV